MTLLADVLSATPPGQTPVGVHDDQTPATVSIRKLHTTVDSARPSRPLFLTTTVTV